MNGLLLLGEPNELLIDLRTRLTNQSVSVYEYGCNEEAFDDLSSWETDKYPIDRIIFGPATIAHDLPRSLSEVDDLAQAHEEAILSFLLQLQAAGRLLARSGGGQIWVITQEQSARYLFPLPTSPIDSYARRAAVKSFAREIKRMDVNVNCLDIQFQMDQTPDDQWRVMRNRVNIYASRLRHQAIASFSKFLCNLLNQDDLPMSGLIVPVGIGLTEQNI